MEIFDPAFDLKQSLDQDVSGQTLGAVCSALHEGHLVLNKAMVMGLPPREYHPALAMKNALDAAEESVNEYWKDRHHKP